MSNKNFKHHTKPTVVAPSEAVESTPDLTPAEAREALVEQILAECIRVEEGKVNTVYPLCRLVAQYKELSLS